MRFSRKTALTGLAGAYAAVGGFRFPGNAAEFNFKWGHFAPLSNPLGGKSKECADRITQDSGGRLDVKVFPAYQLGSDESMITQVRAGALELLAISNGAFAQVVPVAGIGVIPFIFESSKMAWSTMDGPTGNFIRDATRKAGFYVFDKMWELGNKSINNSVRAVNKPEDMKGMKIRIAQSPVPIATFKALGAAPTPLPADQIYVSIQTHLVEGVDADLLSIETLKFYEVAKYISLTNHAWTGLQNVANPDAMQKLPKNLRDLVDRRINEYIVAERNEYQLKTDQVTATLKSQGCMFNTPDLASFRSVIRSAGLYKDWRTQYGADVWTALERSVGSLA